MDQPTFLFTVRDARAALGRLSNTKFYELVSEGRLRLVKIGRRSYVAREEIQRFLRTLHEGE